MVLLDDGDRRAYLDRLGVDAEPPSVDALTRLHQAHVERVPWETLWIQMGEGWGTDPLVSARRIGAEGRGGYCFHLNGALALLLDSLGYRVTGHIGGVHGPDGPSADELTNHLVLTVADLPDDSNPGGVWYLDVGLGDALHAPLPLVVGAYKQGPFQYEIESIAGDGVADWHLVHHPGRGFAGMAWRSDRSEMHAFDDRHTALSTDPDSGFVRWLSVQRRDATGVDVLRGLTLTRSGDDERKVHLDTRDELLDALAEVFGIDLGGRADADLDALWGRVHAADVAWRESRGSSAT